jgi:hypothetical protein
MHGTSTRNKSISCMHELTRSTLSQKYELMEYGYDQSLLIRPEADDGPDQCKPASPPALTIRVPGLTLMICCQIWLSSRLKIAAVIRSSFRRLRVCCASGRSLGVRTTLLRASRPCLIRLFKEQSEWFCWTSKSVDVLRL